MAKKKSPKMPPKGMHKMPNGMMMPDSKMGKPAKKGSKKGK